jgi:hypothetical protein
MAFGAIVRGNEGEVREMQCPKCKSSNVHREHRTATDRWKYAAVFECYDCNHRVGISYLSQPLRLAVPQLFRWPWITLHVRCPHCGETELKVMRSRDEVEDYRRGPLRFAQRLLGAKLYYCWLCRLQFYDLRPRLSDDVHKEEAAG